MRLVDWIIAFALIFMGIGCLTMSATWMMGSGLNNFFNVCMWLGIPLIITAIIYLVFKLKKGERK